MGVKVELRIDEKDPKLARAAAIAAFARIDELDAMWSDWKADSEISRFNAAMTTAPFAVSVETSAAVALALEVAYATEGLFDPTMYPLTLLWREARKSQCFPTEEALAAARKRVDFKQLECVGMGAMQKQSPDLAIDLGGIGKGLAAAELVAVLARNGCPRALVAVAGDIAAGDAPSGSPTWSVDIAWKDGRREAIDVLRQSASTSGDAAQFMVHDGERFAHIIDKKTGLGARNIQQVTVIGARMSSEEILAATITDPHSFISNGGRVDAFATALCLTARVELPTDFRMIRATTPPQ